MFETEVDYRLAKWLIANILNAAGFEFFLQEGRLRE